MALPPPANGVRDAPSSALRILDLYNEKLVDQGKLIGSLFDGFDRNLLAIAILSMLFYLLIFVSLKKKDAL